MNQTAQNRKELRISMREDLDKIFKEYVQLEKILTSKIDIQSATDDFVKKDTEVRKKWNKLIRQNK